MSRSVNYLNNAETIIFFTVNGLDEQIDYEDFERNLICEIKSKLKSYVETNKWGNRETKVILENNLCVIGLSEYCGCWSLSVAGGAEDYYIGYNREALALNHAGQIRKTLEKCLANCGCKVMNKVGTFSNGEALYKYKEV